MTYFITANIVDEIKSIFDAIANFFQVVFNVIVNIFEGIVFVVQLLEQSLSYGASMIQLVPILAPFYLIFTCSLVLGALRTV